MNIKQIGTIHFFNNYGNKINKIPRKRKLTKVKEEKKDKVM